MHLKTKPDSFKYWSYILVYTDDILVVDHEPKVIMDYLASQYTLKPGSVKEPDICTWEHKLASFTSSVFCDNQSVVKNMTAPESVLKKRHNAITYHHAREVQAARIIRVAWENGETQIADLLTKLMPVGPRLRNLLAMCSGHYNADGRVVASVGGLCSAGSWVPLE
jgi:hypothetical protein